MSQRSLLFSSFVALLSVGCMSPRGFDRAKMLDRLSGGIVVNDADIAETLKLRPQLEAGSKLGIHIRTPAFGRYGWDSATKKKLDELCASLVEYGTISTCRFVNLFESPSEKSGFIKTLRLAGARHGVDAVLLLDFASDYNLYSNPLAFTYPLLLTAFFVPGSTADGMCISRGTLWDVRNGFLYMSAETEATSSRTLPFALLSPRNVELDSRRKSEDTLISELKGRLQTLVPNGIHRADR